MSRLRGLASIPVLAVVCACLTATGLAPSSYGATAPLQAWAEVHPPAADPKTDAFVDQLLKSMTLEEKIGQMVQADISSITPADLAHYKLGSILAGGGAAPGNNVRTPPQAWLDLTDNFYRAALATEAPGHPAIPLIFGIDAVHGNAKLIGATIFPHNVGLGAAHDAALLREIGHATAEEVATAGIDWTFAPTVAVVRDVRWGRSYESYSEDPQIVAEYAAAMVEGIQGRRGSPEFLSPGHTLASVKHFLGDGGTRNGRDQGDTQLSEADLSAVHGAGYAAAIKAGAMIVMASYNSWNGVKMHANHHLLTEVLKGRLGFEGFVVGDWNAHEQIPGCTKSACAAAYLAGIDMLMAPDEWKALFDNTLAQARSGEIPMARIEDAVRRILWVKATAGMFTRPAPKQRAAAGQFDQFHSPQHRALARTAVRESLVLLKNDRGVLPLKPQAHVLVCGELADDIGGQSGGWTIDWQGDRNRAEDFPGATSIFGGIQAAARAAGGSATLDVKGEYRERPDVAVVVFGEHPYAEFQGDRETLDFSPQDQQALLLLKRLRSAGIPTVSVFLSGRPLWVNREINASDAFVAAWLPGSEGQGVADMLFGSFNGQPVDFKGRLSFSWPNSAMPVTFQADGSVSGAVYARGYGLSYRNSQQGNALSEEAGIPPAWRSAPGSLYHAAHVTAPWALFVADAGSAQVHVTTDMQTSPQGAVSVQQTAEGEKIRWSGRQEGQFQISGRVRDFRPLAAEGMTLHFTYRLERAANQPVSLTMLCSEPLCGTAHGPKLDLSAALRAAPLHAWRSETVALSCFSKAGADLAAVEMPFVLATAGSLELTLADVSLQKALAKEPAPCPPFQ